MKRLPDWKNRFHAELDAARKRTMQYGMHDCLAFGARIVEAITGENPAAQFGDYETELGAAKLLIEYGGIAGILTHAFGPAAPPLHARPGDLIVAHIDGKETGGVCNGTNVAFVTIPTGIAFRPHP